ncbi:Uncharacterised protein [Suttonella ornithocola]|uniref:Uncharacterized protein n=1 Tax=Suttonella ornithocola TaxID=279832 RepID=A0A380MZ18_9GAMM|nr:Uncharacterised protein [Suttonella ornithocola]
MGIINKKLQTVIIQKKCQYLAKNFQTFPHFSSKQLFIKLIIIFLSVKNSYYYQHNNKIINNYIYFYLRR